jgi:hypothetical protein
VCRAKQRAYAAGYRQRLRNRSVGDGTQEVPPWPLGGAAARLDGGGNREVFVLGLNLEARAALYALVERYREQERKAGRTPKTHQISRIIREAVHQWEHRDCPAQRQPTFVIFEKVHVNLDGPTRAVVARQAASYRFGGNKSAALRAMIQYAAFPFVVGALGGPRRSLMPRM